MTSKDPRSTGERFQAPPRTEVMQAPDQPKSKNKALLIVLLSVGGVIILGCVICGLAILLPAFFGMQQQAQRTVALNQQRQQQQLNQANKNQTKQNSSGQNTRNTSPPRPNVKPKPAVKDSIKSFSDAQRWLKGDSKQQIEALRWISDPGHSLKNAEKEILVPVLIEASAGDHANTAAKALQRCVSEDNIDQILTMIPVTRYHKARGQLFKILESLASEKAIPELVAWMSNKELRGSSVRVLEATGPAIIPHVLPYLNHPDFFIRSDAYKLLIKQDASSQDILSQCLKDLNTTDKAVWSSSISHLSKQKITEESKALVSPALVKELAKADTPRRHHYLKILKNWGRQQDMEQVIPFLDDTDRGTVKLTMQLLQATKTTAAADSIASKLDEFFLRGDARQVLISFGSASEPALIEVINNSQDKGALREAILILGQVGSSESLVHLQKLSNGEDRTLKRDAEKAMAQIIARQ